MSRSARSILVVVLALLGSPLTFGQSDPGTGLPPFGTLNRDQIDTVNVGNLNIHFAFPLFAKKGRGLDFIANVTYDNGLYQPRDVHTFSTGPNDWNPNILRSQGWGVSIRGFGNVTYAAHTSTPQDPPCYDDAGGTRDYWWYSEFVYFDSDNTPP